MEKPILYIPEKDYFIDDVFDYINSTVKESVFSRLSHFILKSKIHISTEQKKLFYLKEVEELSKNIDLDLFYNLIYKISLEENICFIKDSSLLNIIQYSPNYGNKSISCLGKELIDVEFILEDFEIITINDYEEFILKFVEVKGNEHGGLLRHIIDFIVMNMLIEFSNNLIKNSENTQTIKPTKPNKSLLFESKELNLSERFKIANKVLDIDNKIRKLHNIKDLEKYQLLAYILGCDKDNARNLMNGSYKSKDRDLSGYFDDLGLNK